MENKLKLFALVCICLVMSKFMASSDEEFGRSKKYKAISIKNHLQQARKEAKKATNSSDYSKLQEELSANVLLYDKDTFEYIKANFSEVEAKFLRESASSPSVFMQSLQRFSPTNIPISSFQKAKSDFKKTVKHVEALLMYKYDYSKADLGNENQLSPVKPVDDM